MSKPTPTPWHLGDMKEENMGDDVQVVRGPRGELIANVFQQYDVHANAAHIVKCVNMYEEMLDALKAMDEYTHRPWPTREEETCARKGAERYEREQIWAMVRAAIAKAEGEVK